MQHFLKPAAGTAWAEIVSAQLLKKFLIASDNAESPA